MIKFYLGNFKLYDYISFRRLIYLILINFYILRILKIWAGNRPWLFLACLKYLSSYMICDIWTLFAVPGSKKFFFRFYCLLNDGPYIVNIIGFFFLEKIDFRWGENQVWNFGNFWIFFYFLKFVFFLIPGVEKNIFFSSPGRKIVTKR